MSRPIAELVAAGLRHAGVEVLFGLPGGGSNLDVIGAAEAEGLRFVLAHSEGAAVLMAAAAAELTGRPGACVVTRGPGVASAVNGVAHALLDRQPLLLVSDCVPAASRDRVAHQRLDHAALLGPVTKGSFVVGATSTVDDVRAAVALSLAGPPGPRPPRPRPDRAGNPHRRGGGGRRSRPRPTSTRSAPRADRSPAGRHRRRRRDGRAACAASWRGTTVPVLTTYKAKGVVPETGPNAAGIATGATIEAPLLHAADLVVGVGLDPVELIPAPWPYAAPVVLLGTWPTVDDSAYFGDHLLVEVVVPDLDAALGELAPELRSEWPEWHGAGRPARRARPRAGRGARRPTGVLPRTSWPWPGRSRRPGRWPRSTPAPTCSPPSRCGRSTNRASC